MRFGFVTAAVMLVLTACTSTGAERQASRAPGSTVSDDGASADSRTTDSNESEIRRTARRIERLADLRHGVTTRSSKLTVRKRPTRSSPWHKMDMTNPIDQRLVLLIRDTRSTKRAVWLEVLLPERPNGSTAWVRRRQVRIVSLRHRIEVDLSRYTLKHFRNGELVRRFKVGVGQDQYPAPTGAYYVWAKVPQESPTGPYGNYALGLSGFSPVLSDWPGGGRAAVHGTANPGDRGQKVSHGCVRVFNDDMEKLTGVPMGTPVVIKQ